MSFKVNDTKWIRHNLPKLVKIVDKVDRSFTYALGTRLVQRRSTLFAESRNGPIFLIFQDSFLTTFGIKHFRLSNYTLQMSN